MEVIEINSEDTSFKYDTKNDHSVILLTDDSDPIVCTTNSATQRQQLPPSSPCAPNTHDNEVEAIPPASVKKTGSILDIENWLSSSDEDSIELLSMPAPRKRPKKILLSPGSTQKTTATINESEPLHEPREEEPKKASPQQKANISALFVGSELSDPITSSPKTSQVFTEPSHKVLPSNSQTTKPNESKFSKKEWKDANRATRKKEEILGEMIIEYAESLKEKLESSYFEETLEGINRRHKVTAIPTINWKRKVKATYNAEADVFEPCEPKEISEKVIILYYEASDLVDKILNGTLRFDRESAIRRASTEDSSIDYYVMVMVIGLKEYLRKLKGIEDRAYRDQMLLKMNEPLSKKRKQEEIVITAADAQRKIQEAGIDLKLNIFIVRTAQEAIDWLHSFTYTIGSSLYDKFQRNSSLANIGTVRLGSDRRTTFIELLKKFNLMTQPRAEKLYEYYTSPIAMYKRFLKSDTLGTVNGKNIVPPSANAAMKRVFTATDPSQVIT